MHSRRVSNPHARAPSIPVAKHYSHVTPSHSVSIAFTPSSPAGGGSPSRNTPFNLIEGPGSWTGKHRTLVSALPRSGRRLVVALVCLLLLGVCALGLACAVVAPAATSGLLMNAAQEKTVRSRIDPWIQALQTGITGQSTKLTTTAADGVSAGQNLPPCQKTMLFKMAGLHGFGSEFNLLVRAASLAKQMSYTLVPPDSSHWNYGSFSDYFELPHLDCSPPGATYPRTSMTFPAATNGEAKAQRAPKVEPMTWTHKEHVVWGRRDLEGLDRTVVDAFTDAGEVAELHQADVERVEAAREGDALTVNPEDTVPDAYRSAFVVQSEMARELWRPNTQTEAVVRKTANDLGLLNVARNDKEAGDVIVGMHVRLGDKYLETARIGPQAYDKNIPAEPMVTAQPGLHSELLDQYMRAAVASVETVLAQMHPTRARNAAWHGKPTLVVMSDDPDAHKSFERHELGTKFRIVSTPPAPAGAGSRQKRGEGQASEVKLPELSEAQKAKRAKWRLLKLRRYGKREDPGGFNEGTFNALSEADRVEQARAFVRDVTVLARHADALVLTASSNVGRLLMLLAGESMSFNGRVRSIDTRWFPTSQFY